MIEIRTLCKSYETKNGRITALSNINLTFDEQGLVFILGKSGCGKTTLLNLLGGLDSADSGCINVNFLSDNDEGKNILCLSEKEMDMYHNTFLGFVFQDYHLIEEWNVNDNITITLQQQIDDDAQNTTQERVKNVLSYVDLEGIENRKIYELSGGQAQRVAIARALVKEPRVILADEPTGNLDSKNSENIFALLKKISRERLVIVVTHDEQAAMEYGDRIIRLKDGCTTDDVDNCKLHQQYCVVVSECEGDLESSFTTKSIDKLKRFICDKIVSDISEKKFIVDLKIEHVETNKEKLSSRYRERSVKNVNLTTILRLAIDNLKLRRARLAITIAIFVLTLMFLQIITEISVSNYDKAVCEYLADNNVKSIYLGTDIGYIDDFFDENIVTRGNTKNIRDIADEFVKQNKGCVSISEAPISYENNELIIQINSNTAHMKLIDGGWPVNENDICITDYCVKLLGLDNKCMGTEVLIYGVAFNISGVIDTNYEESQMLEKASSELTPYDDYIIRHIYSKGISSSGFSEYLNKEGDIVSIEASNFFTDGVGYINSNLKYASQDSVVEDYSLECGRMPQKDNEILVSYDFARRNGMIGSDLQLVEEEFAYTNIYDKKYNGAYDGRINMYDVFQNHNVIVVGIIEAYGESDADVWINDTVFKKLKEEYFYSQIYDSYELMLDDIAYNQIKSYVSRMRLGNVYIQEPNIEQIYNIYANKDRIYMVGVALMIAFILLTILLNVSFLTYSVSDNHRKIGILRALGVNKKTISSIFMCESLFISILSYLISYLVSTIVFDQINIVLGRFIECDICFFYRNNIVALSVFIISLILGIMSVVLPVISMSKQNIIELIKG